MTVRGIVPGCILHHKDFRFEDGETKNKFFIVAGAKPGHNYLSFMATSQRHHRKFVAGCNANEGYYLIPGGGKDWFPHDTWVLLARPLELSASEVIRLSMVEKLLTIEGYLREQVANEIRNCAKRCKDVSPLHLDLL